MRRPLPLRPSHAGLSSVVLSGVALALLGACTGTPAAPSGEPSVQPTPSIVVDDGIAAPQALQGLSCEADDRGRWSAKGRVANDGRQPRTFRVTVQVGPASDAASARRITLDDVPAGRSAPFEVPRVPTSGDDGPCHVQVLILGES